MILTAIKQSATTYCVTPAKYLPYVPLKPLKISYIPSTHPQRINIDIIQENGYMHAQLFSHAPTLCELQGV